jgi:hypothetical protein
MSARVERSSMRRRHHSFKERVLAILERVAELWAALFRHLVALPALNRALRTKEDVDAAERQLLCTDARITRAIYTTARRLAGLCRASLAPSRTSTGRN